MGDQYDVVVVGAGVEGSSTAYNLVQSGSRRVLLLEQVSIYNLNMNTSNFVALIRPPNISLVSLCATL